MFDRIVSKTYYTEKEARDVVRTLLRTMKHLHDQNIIHRDLKVCLYSNNKIIMGGSVSTINTNTIPGITTVLYHFFPWYDAVLITFLFSFFSLISLTADGPHHCHPACGH